MRARPITEHPEQLAIPPQIKPIMTLTSPAWPQYNNDQVLHYTCSLLAGQLEYGRDLDLSSLQREQVACTPLTLCKRTDSDVSREPTSDLQTATRKSVYFFPECVDAVAVASTRSGCCMPSAFAAAAVTASGLRHQAGYQPSKSSMMSPVEYMYETSDRSRHPASLNVSTAPDSLTSISGPNSWRTPAFAQL